MFRFEKLDVWQEARALNREVYCLTRQFPAEERFGLTAQLRRASVSVSSNIAEGSGRNSDKDFAHFLEMAYGSLMEVTSQFYLALDELSVTEEKLTPVLSRITKIASQLTGLNRSLGISDSKVSPRPAR